MPEEAYRYGFGNSPYIDIARIFRDGCITPGARRTVASGAPGSPKGPHLLLIKGLSSLKGGPAGDGS